MTRKRRGDQRPWSASDRNEPRRRDDRTVARRAITLSESFQFAGAGLVHYFTSQRNARIHAVVAVVVLVVGVLVGLSTIELAIIVGAIGLVFVSEMFNTVTEAIVDLVTDQWHPLAKVAKDVGAATVLVASIVAVVIGLLILGPHLLSYIATFTRPA